MSRKQLLLRTVSIRALHRASPYLIEGVRAHVAMLEKIAKGETP